MGMSSLIFVADETGASKPLPSKFTSAYAAVPAFRQCLPNRCLAIDFFVTVYKMTVYFCCGSSS
jgi:hypothetical protein